MSPTSVVLRASARQDVDEAIAHYIDEGGAEAALGFIDALEGALEHLAHHAGSGSPRYGHELNLPGLRSWPIKPSPHLAFYMEGRRHVDVWRILHGREDIPAWMRI